MNKNKLNECSYERIYYFINVLIKTKNILIILPISCPTWVSH